MNKNIVHKVYGNGNRWIPINGEGTKLPVGQDQYDVAREWAKRTAHDPDGVHAASTIFNPLDEGDKHMVAITLAWIEVLVVRGHGYVMPRRVRQHLEQYGGGRDG